MIECPGSYKIVNGHRLLLRIHLKKLYPVNVDCVRSDLDAFESSEPLNVLQVQSQQAGVQSLV